MPPRPLSLLLLAALLGCAGPKSKVIEDAGEFPHHRCIGVAPFVDPRGRGQVVADAIEAGLQQLMFEPVDQKALAQALAGIPDRGPNLGLESLEKIHSKTPADAIIFGRLSPDWSTALITVTETEMGAPILQAVLRPRDSRKKAFTGPDEIAKEALRLLMSVR